jgi:hypothetical protein
MERTTNSNPFYRRQPVLNSSHAGSRRVVDECPDLPNYSAEGMFRTVPYELPVIAESRSATNLLDGRLVDPSAVHQLQSLGYVPEVAIEALASSDGSVEVAAARLAGETRLRGKANPHADANFNLSERFSNRPSRFRLAAPSNTTGSGNASAIAATIDSQVRVKNLQMQTQQARPGESYV